MVRVSKISTLTLACVSCVAGVLGLGGVSAPAFAAGTIKAAYVEQVIPVRTWSVEIDVNGVVN